MGNDPLDRHEVGGLYVIATVSYIRRACGDEGVAAVLERAGIAPDALPRENDWLSLAKMFALAAAAADVTGDPEVGRRVGEEIFELNIASGLDQMMRSAGGPAEAIALLASHGSRLAGGWSLEVTDRGEDWAEITSSTELETEHPFFCGTGMGYYTRVPEVFGHLATAVHPECMTRGAPHCRYIIRWGTAVEVAGGPSFDPVAYFERMQSVASELASASNPADLIELAAAAGPAVTTSRSIVIQVTQGIAESLIGHRGIADQDALDHIIWRVEQAQLASSDGEEPVICVAPMTTSRNTYGWIASVHPPRSTIDWTVERPLAAFADHVASALEATLAHEEARRDRDIAHALVVLARDLAAATDRIEVATILAESVGQASSAKQIDVWLTDPEDNTVRSVFTGDVMATPPRHDASHVAIPLVARGAELGLLAVVWPDESPPSPDELERIAAMADQAALAFDVAGLVADLKRQARHDPLSGLANRALLAERAEIALAQARRTGSYVGLLFIDLDHFKAINDSFGHAGGDQVICQVADRLRSIVRANDTVARFGGDEFVVLLTDLGGSDAAMAAGHRVHEVMGDPFNIDGSPVTVAATVGVHSAPPGELTWPELVGRADAAMYAGKQQGRDAVIRA